MFAIEWALIVCNVISTLTTLPAMIFGVDSEKYHAYTERFFDKMPSAQDLPLLKLMMKFQFYAMFSLYVLGIFAGFYCATPVIGYMFGAGNFFRVIYFAWIIYGDAQKFAFTGMNAKQLNIILGVQSVLGLVILGCTYLSSQNEEYQAAMAEMAAAAAGKWDDYGFYLTFVLSMHGFFTLVQLPGVIAPGFAIKNYITVESKLPTDKGSNYVLEFVMGFQQLIILLTQVFGAVMLWYSPVIDPIAIFWMIFGGIYFTVTIFSFNIINADAYGFDRVPMMIFMVLNTFVAGASFQAYFE